MIPPAPQNRSSEVHLGTTRGGWLSFIGGAREFEEVAEGVEEGLGVGEFGGFRFGPVVDEGFY